MNGIFRWTLFLLGWGIIDVVVWDIGVVKYFLVQVGGVILYISGLLVSVED
jgi:hypothetical protein